MRVPPITFLFVMLLCGGAGTVLLRRAIVTDGPDEARFYRALIQTVVVLGGIGALVGVQRSLPPMRAGVVFAALNGAISGVAFILFGEGLETVKASTGKPALVVSMIVAVVLGISLLGEPLSVMKLGGVILAGIGIYLLSSE